ncbi:hypothetical protein AVEN_164396-1 [Araneus ventricosus]|uniref:Uncharacterized protein n=1 Tax=Araneus ventricosus TaxID=182803 RepID=A0A4Y2VVP2_ARAVE|nr:hypothetical protein AVEN_164396-1 [Araneus ventricosus]
MSSSSSTLSQELQQAWDTDSSDKMSRNGALAQERVSWDTDLNKDDTDSKVTRCQKQQITFGSRTSWRTQIPSSNENSRGATLAQRHLGGQILSDREVKTAVQHCPPKNILEDTDSK